MESQPQNPEFRINPENFHTCILAINFNTLVEKVNQQSLIRLFHKEQADLGLLCNTFPFWVFPLWYLRVVLFSEKQMFSHHIPSNLNQLASLSPKAN